MAVRVARLELARQRWTFLPASVVRGLITREAAMTKDTEAEFVSFWSHAVPQEDEGGAQVYPYKGSLVSYYQTAVPRGKVGGSAFSISRSASHDLPGSECRAREYIDPSTIGPESKFRAHKQWPVAADRNPIVRGLQRLIWDVLRESKATENESVPESYESSEPIDWTPAPGTLRVQTPCAGELYEPMMTAYRVTKEAQDSGSERRTFDAEPGPEGVHQDLAELTAIVLVKRDNLAPSSGGNRVWSLEQPCGKAALDIVGNESQVHRRNLLAELVLLERFDMLLVLDREVKHEALPIHVAEGAEKGVRDVLTFEVRRPRVVPDGVECC